MKLRDGTRVRLRVVQPADRELLRRGFDRLSPRSRYLRFLSPKNGLSDTEVDDLMTLDGRDRFALGAQRLQPGGGEGEGLGIARFARVPDTPAVAEAAVTVTDEAQGKGLGTMLLVRLAAAARERGVERFTCEFDAGNEQIWHLINHLEPRVEVLDHGFVRAEVPVPPVGAQPGPRKARPPAPAATGASANPTTSARESQERVRTMERFWTKHYDAGVPVSVPFEERTLVGYLDRAAAEWPDRPALTLKGRTLTYRKLKDQVDRFATALAKLGVGKDSRVALWMPNLPPMVIGFFATQRLGAQVVNTNPLYVERELVHQFKDAGVTVVVTLDYLWMSRLRAIRARTPVQHVVVTKIPDYLPFPLNLLAPLKLRKTGQIADVPREEGVHVFKELIAQNPPRPPKVEVGLDHVAVLQYTGGTTGLSKGAMLTHRNLSFNAQQCNAWFPMVQPGREVFLACLPYFHVFGMTASLGWPTVCGAHIVLAPNPRDIPDLVKSIVRYRVTQFPAVPALFVAINNHPGVEKLDVSSIRGCFSGSAPLPVEVLERFERLTGSKITEGFGMTETSPVTHGNPLNGLRKPGTVGVPISDTDQRVVDLETGSRELPIGEEGELCIRGPQVMAGYWNRPEETAHTLVDGWVHTGDLARIDEDGYCTIVGRKKDMIVVSGYNVYPDEVDAVLFAHPAVLEAATIGLPDVRKGEIVKSFVVLRPGAAATEQDVIDHCRRELAAYKVPRSIEFVPELPKSSMMKILRRELREREIARMTERVKEVAPTEA